MIENEKNEVKYITVKGCPPEIHRAAQLWKPILNVSINEIYIEMLKKGAEVMQYDVLAKSKEMFQPLKMENGENVCK